MFIPKPYTEMKERFPGLVGSYETLGNECKNAGPLDEKMVAMIKLATWSFIGVPRNMIRSFKSRE